MFDKILSNKWIKFAGKATLVVFLLDLAAALAIVAAAYFGFMAN
jgi:hypothetical protein